MIQRKKGQFFIISIVLLTLALFVVFAYIRSTDVASSTLFKRSSAQDITNIANAIKERNMWLADWWNLTCSGRKHINITGPLDDPVEVYVNLSGFNCLNTKITTLGNSPIEAYNASSTPPCSFTFNAGGEREFYVYYNCSVPFITTDMQGNETSAQIIKIEEPFYKLCPHLTKLYAERGISLNCSENPEVTSLNYSIDFGSLDLKFKGQIS